MGRRAIVRPGAARRGSLLARRGGSPATIEKSPAPHRNPRSDRARAKTCSKGGNNGDRAHRRKLSRRWKIDASEVATCRRFCRHLTARMTGSGDKSGLHVASFVATRDGSKICFEVLRLGSEGAARRAENFHHGIPANRIDPGFGAPIPEWHNLLRAIDRRHPRGARTNHAPTTQHGRTTRAHRTGAADRRYPKTPGLGVGVSLHSLHPASAKLASADRRTAAGQRPNKHRTDVKRTPNKTGTM